MNTPVPRPSPQPSPSPVPVQPHPAPDLPVAFPEIRKWAERLHVDDPTWYIERIADVDIDAIRSMAQQVWGTGTATAAPQRALVQIRDDLDTGLLTTVQDRWGGDAYLAFEEYVNKIQQALQEEAERFPQLGDALVEFADAFDASISDMISYALTVEGLVASMAGVAIAVATAPTGVGPVVGLIVSLFGLVVSIISGLHTLFSAIIPQLYAIAVAEGVSLREVKAESPLDLLPSFPSNIDDWIPKTP